MRDESRKEEGEEKDGASRRRFLKTGLVTGLGGASSYFADRSRAESLIEETDQGVPIGEEDESRSTIENGSLWVEISHDPFGIRFTQTDGDGPSGMGFPGVSDELDLESVGKYGTFGFAIGESEQTITHGLSYGVPVAAEVTWHHATQVLEKSGNTFTVATTDPAGRTANVEILKADGGIITVDVELSNTTGVIKTGWSFRRMDDERFLGFGERSARVDQTGHEVENWVEEGPFSSGVAKPVADPTLGERFQGPPPYGSGTNYPIPWFISSLGYGFLLDSTYYNTFELANVHSDVWHVETWENSLTLSVFAGPTPAETLTRFTDFVGRQPEPAKWFFGPWYHAPDGSQMKFVEDWREWDIPVTVGQTYTQYLPCAHHMAYRDHQSRKTSYYHSWGYKITTYVSCFVCRSHPGGAYEEGDNNGFFLKTPEGSTYPIWYAGGANDDPHPAGKIDFTDSAATAWWQDLVADALDDGYDGWMEDFGEYVPPNAVTSDGRTGHEIHNRYPTLFHETGYSLTRARRGKDFAQYVRSGYTRTAQYARIVWGGDPSQDYSKSDGLAAAISQGQSMGLSGVSYWGTDIGGFHAVTKERQTDAELLIRWLEYGAFAGVMRTQAEGYARPVETSDRANVWDEAVRPIWRKFTKLRTQLFPYIWKAAVEYQDSGIPIIRHLALVSPEDPMVYSSEAEYEFMFGPDVLVAPVIEEGTRERKVYLPEGDWINFWQAVAYDEDSGSFTRKPGRPQIISGEQTVSVDAPLDEIPMFVRAGSTFELLPARVDTLADTGDRPEVVKLSDVGDERNKLTFPASGNRGSNRPEQPPSSNRTRSPDTEGYKR